ncbi:MAG: mannonate dehydratase, partial [Armatimonadota bacterium]
MTERPHPLRSVPGFGGTHPGIQIGTYVNSTATDDELRFLQQVGVEWAMLIVDDPGQQTAEHYKRFDERLDRYGMRIYRIANHAVHNVEEITLGLPGRDEKIREFLDFLGELGKAGIRYHTYAHMGNGIWSTGSTPGRGGVDSRVLDIANAKGYWNGKVFQGELTHGRPYSEDELWDNYEYFIRQVVPVAEENGVFVGVHPDDPPVYALGGVPRCIFGNFDGYRRALEIAGSPNIGVCLCIGCWLEGGTLGMGNSVIDAIRHFGERGQLFKVHFRNVSNPMP